MLMVGVTASDRGHSYELPTRNAASGRRFFRVNFRNYAAFEDAAFIRGRCLLEGCVYKRGAFKKRKYGKASATRAIFFLWRWQCNFKKLLHYHREKNIALVACLALAMQHLLKSCRNIANSEYFGNLSVSKSCHRTV